MTIDLLPRNTPAPVEFSPTPASPATVCEATHAPVFNPADLAPIVTPGQRATRIEGVARAWRDGWSDGPTQVDASAETRTLRAG